MISLRDIRFTYDRGEFSFSLESLVLEEGKNAALIGPSGSGKTTLLNLIAGVLVPQGGEVLVDGMTVSTLSDAERRAYRIRNIGFIFQDFALIEYLNVLDNILHPFRISRAIKLDADSRERARSLAFEMGIGDRLNRYPGELSHGERQRVAICRALVTNPKLILADEATGNLDPENKERIIDLLFQAVSERNATVLSVTHDHDLLRRFDRVIDFAEFRRAA